MKKSKYLIIILIILNIIVTAVYAFGVFNNDILKDAMLNSGKNPATNENYFEVYRKERTETRMQEILLLDNIIENSELSETTKEKAIEQKIKLITTIEKELITECLIKAKGFEDSIVVFTENKVYVIVKTEEMTEENSLAILDIIMQECNVEAHQIKISVL